MISPPPKCWTTTYENAWQYRRTCPLKISNSPFRINGFAHKRTSPLKKISLCICSLHIDKQPLLRMPGNKRWLDHKEQSISNNFLYAQNGLARPQKNLSWLFPSQMMNSYVQECLMILLDIFRQRMKHSTSNYCYFAQNNVARLKKSIMTPPPSKNEQLNLNGKITSHIECQTFDICHWMANGEWRMSC